MWITGTGVVQADRLCGKRDGNDACIFGGVFP